MATSSLEVETTVYVNKYFEVRTHEAPTKYVFNGLARVAQVTGSLSTNLRLQRLRVFPGWNLCSLAVSATNALHQLTDSAPAGTVTALYRWVPDTSDFAPVASGQALAAGSVVWLQAVTNANLAIVGNYSEPTPVDLASGGMFIGCAGLEIWRLNEVLPPAVTAWKHLPATGEWKAWFNGMLGFLSDFPEFIAPGDAVYVQSDTPVQLEAPESALRIRYYHHDHLNSAAVLTDAGGAVLEETGYYPFGQPRHSFQPEGLAEAYQFTQKERDKESGLNYFEARYLSGLQGRFLSPDPLPNGNPNPRSPQRWNTYAYAANNPLRFTDPYGLYVWDESLGGAKADKDVSEDVRKQRTEFREALKSGLEKANAMAEGADKQLVLRGLKAYGDPDVANVAVGQQTNPGGHWARKNGKHTVTFSQGIANESLAGTLAHEGTHFADDVEFWTAAKADRNAAKAGPLNRTDYEQEFRGYKVEALLAKAFGRSYLKKGDYTLWSNKWKPEEVEKNRSEAINQLLEHVEIYKLTPQKPGKKYLE